MKFSSKMSILVLAATLGLTACKSEKQLVVDTAAFVTGLGSQYSVAKSISSQRGYAVLLNSSNGKYMAVNLTSWNPAESSAQSHLESQTQSGRVYFNLRSQGNGSFVDNGSGMVFEGSESIVKDGQTAAGFAEQLNIEEAQSRLIDMGVSSERAASLANLVVAKATKSEMNAEDVNAVLEAVGDTSLSELLDAGSDAQASSDLIERAARKNNMSSEQLKDLVLNILN